MSTLLTQVAEPYIQPTTGLSKSKHRLDTCPICHAFKDARAIRCAKCQIRPKKRSKDRPSEDLNTYVYKGKLFRRIALTQDKYMLVSAHRYEELNAHAWRAYDSYGKSMKGSFIAITALRGTKGSSLAAHRFITNAPKGMEVDHWNHDTLDNRDENLTVCTNSMNHRNMRISIKSSTGRIGVNYSSLKDNFRAVIFFEGRTRFLGEFKNIDAAAERRDQEAIKLLGPFALTNAELQRHIACRLDERVFENSAIVSGPRLVSPLAAEIEAATV